MDNKTIELDGVDYSGLFRSTYDFLIRDLYGYYVGKQVLIKGNTIYLDLIGSNNSQSINHMIQEEIDHLREEQYLYAGPYGIYSK